METPLLTQCPHCGSTVGYYTKAQVSGTVIYRHNFDGSSGENGEMYDGLRHKGGKVAYCQDCDKRLFKIGE